MTIDRRTLLGTAAASLALPNLARAQAGESEITVEGARQAPIPIAIPSLGPGIGAQITEVINNDLEGSGLFHPLGAAASASSGDTPDFATFKQLGARAVVTGTASSGGAGVTAAIRLWDVNSGQQLQGTQYTAASSSWRRIAHKIADVIYERMLGETGYFDTRIAYVALSGGRANQVTRLAIMDQDGANNVFLTGGQWLVHTPRFSPVAEELAYLSYQDNRPRVFLYSLASGRQSVLGEFPGISFAPRFSPSGGSVILSATRGAGSDIFTVDLGSRTQTQLTSSGAIDTSPCYSPDGSQIVFVSDRGGTPQLYVMSAGGGGARRISYGHGSYGAPVWSPRGDQITYVRYGGGGGFSLGIMSPDGRGERILQQAFTIDTPTFCPNGRVIAYCQQSSAGPGGGGFSSVIGEIDIAGFNNRNLATGSACDPAWSPLRK